MSLVLSQILGTEPPQISQQSIVHAQTEMNTAEYNFFGKLFKADNQRNYELIENVTNNYYPHLFEIVARPIYPYWLNIFQQSWHSRFQSRWIKSSKMQIYSPGGVSYRGPEKWIEFIKRKETPDFGYENYEDGANLPHFRRYLQYVIANGRYKPYFWDSRPLVAFGFFSYICPWNNQGFKFHKAHTYRLDLFEWELGQKETAHASQLREQLWHGKAPSISKSKATNTSFDKPLACIYAGLCSSGKTYIGQTSNEPELRFLQHRTDRTGPFKSGESHVEWKILKRNVEPNDLNYWEAYYIGLYDSFEKGYNETRGNSPRGYQDGVARR